MGASLDEPLRAILSNSRAPAPSSHGPYDCLYDCRALSARDDGPLAQLVERHVYTVDVIGSSPVGPTKQSAGWPRLFPGSACLLPFGSGVRVGVVLVQLRIQDCEYLTTGLITRRSQVQGELPLWGNSDAS